MIVRIPIDQARSAGKYEEYASVAVEVTSTHIRIDRKEYERISGKILPGSHVEAFVSSRAGKRMASNAVVASESLRRQPKWSLSNLASVTSAVAFGQEVTQTRRQKRLEVCMSCDKLVNDGPSLRCGVCGCKLRGQSNALVDLLRYEETSRYGCKHPKGSQWKKQGV